MEGLSDKEIVAKIDQMIDALSSNVAEIPKSGERGFDGKRTYYTGNKTVFGELTSIRDSLAKRDISTKE